ncbi:hypothetical protein B6D18_09195 [Gilliamella sp. A7]|nr:hypothetical protein B6D18_09195 [Gilliamella sp. A7]
MRILEFFIDILKINTKLVFLIYIKQKVMDRGNVALGYDIESINVRNLKKDISQKMGMLK